MDEELKQYLHAMEARIDKRFADMHTDLVERMRDMQTELLKAFLPAQEQNASRDAVLEKRFSGMEERLAIMQKRLFEIEKRLLLDPPAA